ncbi:hypothetical protein EMIT053CA3_60256 [Pseudomonas donghuensis]
MTGAHETYEIKSFLSFFNYFQNAGGHLDVCRVTLARLLRLPPDSVQSSLARPHQLDLEDHNAVLFFAKRCVRHSRRLLGLADVRPGNLKRAGHPAHA